MTAPDTNTPRDGLTDARELRAWADRMSFDGEVGHGWQMQFRKIVRVMDAAIAAHNQRAADREARPAPASVGWRWTQYVNDDGVMCDAWVSTSALAASTPPAEAQKLTFQWHRDAETGEVLSGPATTPPASEARATGDAAKVATDAALDAVRDAMLEPSDGAAKRAFLAVELLGAMLAATGAAGEPQPLRWAMEYGAWEFPMGHPSRVTVVTLHDTESEAREAGMAAEFNFRVFPIYGPQAGEPQPRAGSKP